MSLSLFLCFCFTISLSVSLSLHTHTNTYTQAHAQKNIHHVQNTHASHTTITTNIHARTHTYSTKTSKTLKQKLKADSLCPSKPTYVLSSSVLLQLLFYLHRTVHLFMLLTISGETMCGGHQRTLSNRRLPSSQSKPTAVDRQKDFFINYGNASQSLQNPTRKKRNWRKNQRVHVESPKPACACKHAPAHLSTRQITSVGRPRTATHVDNRQLHTSTRTSRVFSRTRRETCARAVATLPKSRPN